jgi:hypothetical protein
MGNACLKFRLRRSSNAEFQRQSDINDPPVLTNSGVPVAVTPRRADFHLAITTQQNLECDLNTTVRAPVSEKLSSTN